MALKKSDRRVLKKLSKAELDTVFRKVEALIEKLRARKEAATGDTVCLILTKGEFNQLKPRRIVFSNRPLRIVFLMALEEAFGLTEKDIRLKMHTRLSGDMANTPIPVFERGELIVRFS